MPIKFPGTRVPNVTNFHRSTLPRFRAIQFLAQESPPHTKPRYSLSDDTLSRPKPLERNYINTTLYPGKIPIAAAMETNILAVDPTKLGKISLLPTEDGLVEEWHIEPHAHDAQAQAREGKSEGEGVGEGEDMNSLQRAARELRETSTPVAFPTETVYGLGADATRSEAVRAIFAAKGRPADNPLIVHVHSIAQLRSILAGSSQTQETQQQKEEEKTDLIPAIYKPLIRKFWPGPLTIILPVPENGSILAPEVTAGLATFGARMPRSILALALIRLANVPLAAPSANASTRPSPTAAEHVKDDLDGRIHTIIDGGPCEVGVESTVVDGLSTPPSILRPGGITVEQLRQCEGWEGVVAGYKDKAEEGGSKPRAPGMKYRHYSPKAPVFLCEAGAKTEIEWIRKQTQVYKSVGVIRTTSWGEGLGFPVQRDGKEARNGHATHATSSANAQSVVMLGGTSQSHSQSNLLRSLIQHQVPHAEHLVAQTDSAENLDIWDINLGAETEDVARGLFSALRELDKKGVEAIFVEGIDDKAGDNIAAAVMNRLRKAAEVRI